MKVKEIKLSEIVGKGYNDFWKFKGRYRVCKGSRASKKSCVCALYYITKMMQHPEANLLCIRKVYATLKDSVFANFKWAVKRLGVEKYWSFKISPLEITYIPTGQKILFRGCDDPLKITSITVDTGKLCWVLIEEAFEISENEFNMIDESIRGSLDSSDLWKNITAIFNPWSDTTFLKRRFFDTPNDENKFAMTTNYTCNEFLDEADLAMFERMKVENPRRYSVAGLGNWGVAEGLVYENWNVEMFDVQEIVKKNGIKGYWGLDFGYIVDESAFIFILADSIEKKLYICDEFYKKGLTNEEIAKEIIRKGYNKEIITADASEPKSIDQLRTLGISRIRAARKGPDSILHGIQNISDYKIIIHPSCKNFLEEISTYAWDKDKLGNMLNKPVDKKNHLMDAMRYALESHFKPKNFSFS